MKIIAKIITIGSRIMSGRTILVRHTLVQIYKIKCYSCYSITYVHTGLPPNMETVNIRLETRECLDIPSLH